MRAGVLRGIRTVRRPGPGLEAAHEENTVHRDLKPANITIRPEGSLQVPDFVPATEEGTQPASGSDSTAPFSFLFQGNCAPAARNESGVDSGGKYDDFMLQKSGLS